MQYQTGTTRLQQVNSELAAVSHILAEDFELMMDRDRNLSSISREANWACRHGTEGRRHPHEVFRGTLREFAHRLAIVQGQV